MIKGLIAGKFLLNYPAQKHHRQIHPAQMHVSSVLIPIASTVRRLDALIQLVEAELLMTWFDKMDNHEPTILDKLNEKND